MSYALATYLVVVLSVLAYAGWLARTRRRLARELERGSEGNGG